MKSVSVLRTVSALLASAILLWPITAAAPHYSEEVVVLVDTTADASVQEILSRVRGEDVLFEYDLINTLALSLPADQLPALRAAPGVITVSRSAEFAAPAASRGKSYDGNEIDPRDTVLRSDDPHTGEGALIAILDTGFNVEHPSFTMPDGVEGKITKEDLPELLRDTYVIYRQTREKITDTYVSPKIPFAYDYGDSDTDVMCTSTHGTHVAATAAGSGELYGTAPGAQLLLMKVFDANNSCKEHTLIMAIEDAVKMGADVINLSLGTLALSSTVIAMSRLAQVIRSAQSKGVHVICAIGNNGRAGSMGATSDAFRADAPDYGLVSEPAVLDGTLAVGAAVNRILYAGYVEVAGRKIVYDHSSEASLDQIPTLAEALGGKSTTLAVVGGVGRDSDYDTLFVTGKIALIRRGEISFEEKVKTAAEHGAIGVIVYDPQPDGEAFLMTVGTDSPIPAVTVSHKDGEFLSKQQGKAITVSKKEGVFPAAARGVASYSSYGPSSDLTLKPDICAVGSYVISADVGGAYSVMSGTSMAAPQIAGMAAAFMSENRDVLQAMSPAERSGYVKSSLMSAAEPMREENGVPLSPRGQGAGVLSHLPGDILMTGEDGRGSITFGDGNTGEFSLSLTLTNRGEEEKTVTLRCETVTDRAVEKDGVWYTTYLPEKVPAVTRLELNEHIRLDAESGAILCTLRGGESTSLHLDVTVDPAYMESHKAIFQNGFYLEGYVIAEDEQGRHQASTPFLSFAGDWSHAPMMDGGDWDGYESYYGGQYIYQESDTIAFCAGKTDSGVLSELFMFSPNGDGSAERVFWTMKPLRHISECTIEVFDARGERVFRNVGASIPKSYVDEGKLTHTLLHLWDGSDGFNEKYIWEDGAYTIRVTLTSFSGGVQVMDIPMMVDTAKPKITACTARDGILSAAVSDNGYLKELRIYLPTGEDTYAVNEILTPAYDPDVHTAEIRAELPENIEYVYVRAEDFAGNVTVYRHYLDSGKGE